MSENYNEEIMKFLNENITNIERFEIDEYEVNIIMKDGRVVELSGNYEGIHGTIYKNQLKPFVVRREE